jgi:streptomycin 6-kinase
VHDAGGRIDAALLELERRWTAYWPSRDAASLVADVRARLDSAVDEWDLQDARPLIGGQVALVCAAERDGAPVVVKANPRGTGDDRQLATEGDALAFWATTDAVPRVLGVRDDGFTILLDRLMPGHALDDAALTWDERLTTLGRLAARLHAAGPAPSRFLHAGAFLESWRPVVAGDRALSRELEELLRPARSDVLVHLDLHGGNALRHGDGWKVIDPKGVRADRHADIWALLDPLVPPLPADARAAAGTARERVARYAAAADMDIERATAWTRVRARAEALELEAQARPTGEERAWARRLHRMADVLPSAARPAS